MTEHEHTTSAPSVETFRAVSDFPTYRVSDKGRVQSCSKYSRMKEHAGQEWHDLKPVVEKGYLRVLLYRNKRDRAMFYVHDLVLEAFVGTCHESMECRHLDGNRLNNHLDNLCWGTSQQNADDRARHGRTHKRPGESHPQSKYTNEQVLDIRRRWTEGKSARTIATELGIPRTTVSNIVHGYKWKHLLPS